MTHRVCQEKTDTLAYKRLPVTMDDEVVVHFKGESRKVARGLLRGALRRFSGDKNFSTTKEFFLDKDVDRCVSQFDAAVYGAFLDAALSNRFTVPVGSLFAVEALADFWDCENVRSFIDSALKSVSDPLRSIHWLLHLEKVGGDKKEWEEAVDHLTELLKAQTEDNLIVDSFLLIQISSEALKRILRSVRLPANFVVDFCLQKKDLKLAQELLQRERLEDLSFRQFRALQDLGFAFDDEIKKKHVTLEELLAQTNEPPPSPASPPPPQMEILDDYLHYVKNCAEEMQKEYEEAIQEAGAEEEEEEEEEEEDEEEEEA